MLQPIRQQTSGVGVRSRQAGCGIADVPVIPAVCPACWHEVSFFSPHVQPLHEPPDTAHTHTQAARRLQSIGHLGQGQVILYFTPTLHLGASGCIDLRRAARPFPVGFQ